MEKRFLAVLVNLLVGVSVALGDGGMFLRRTPNTQADVFQPTQKVYIRWNGSQEKLLIQTKYEGPAEEMVWIIPVPSQPTVERADGSIFNDLSKLTAEPDVDYTEFVDLTVSTWSVGGISNPSSDPVEWHERIGSYDVALLRPVGGENVIQWLNANDFTVPDPIKPVLEDYLHDGWWMVAARIHPEALSSITREKLATGTLHPLDMTFQSPVCVFPMRLTSMVSGPVEELIYIEGPAHYEPATLTEGPWDIKLYGGPLREVPQNYVLQNLEHALAIRDGKTEMSLGPCLTKLRRVFRPDEMTEDLVFRELDLVRWLAGDDLLRVAQAATQYGRWRDPNGVMPLLMALSPEALDKVIPDLQDYQPWPSPSGRFLSSSGMLRWSSRLGVTSLRRLTIASEIWAIGCGHLRSCIWALGEIAVENPLSGEAEAVFLQCAQHDNQLIRMEAYIALAKMRSERCGMIFSSRLSEVLENAPPATAWSIDLQIAMGELNVLADGIWQFGTAEQKDTLVGLVRRLLGEIPVDTNYFITERQEWEMTSNGHWPTWIVFRAASTQDPRLINALESRHPEDPNARVSPVPTALLRAEAACGAPEAIAAMIQQVLREADRTVEPSKFATVDHTSLETQSLRTDIVYRRGRRYELYPIPLDISDEIMRSALSKDGLTDWHQLYLLVRIKNPEALERELLEQIWDTGDESRQLLVIDVLYVWGDEQTLMDLYAGAEFSRVKTEIAWALAQLESHAATPMLEEQVHECWNPRWLSLGRTFLYMNTSERLPTYLDTEMGRVVQMVWSHFHPTSGVPDTGRLAALKRLAADRTIHAGARFELLGKDYGGTEWGLPLLERAARDILAVDSSPATILRITSMMKAVGNSGFVIDASSN